MLVFSELTQKLSFIGQNSEIHSASTKFQDWHYKKYLLERNDTFTVQFSTYIPSNCTHRFARSYNFWMPLQKSSFAMVFNVLVTAFWISEIESKRRPFKWGFTFGNKRQSAGVNSGEHGGWSSTVTFRWAKNCLSIVALWDGVLSCKKEPVTRLTHARSNTSNSVQEPFHYNLQYTALIISPSGTNSLWITPYQSKKITNMVFTRDF